MACHEPAFSLFADPILRMGCRLFAMTTRSKILFAFISFACCLSPIATSAFAQSAEEKQYLLMYFKKEELIVEAPTQARKSLAQTRRTCPW